MSGRFEYEDFSGRWQIAENDKTALVRRSNNFRTRAQITASLAVALTVMTFLSFICLNYQHLLTAIRTIIVCLAEGIKPPPPLEQSLAAIEAGREGFQKTTVRYPEKLIDVMIRGDREIRDILASYKTLADAWQRECPTGSLTIEFVTQPVFDAFLGIPSDFRRTRQEVVDATNFELVRPFLRDISELIRESEPIGSPLGLGTLLHSGYLAEAAMSRGSEPDHPLTVLLDQRIPVTTRRTPAKIGQATSTADDGRENPTDSADVIAELDGFANHSCFYLSQSRERTLAWRLTEPHENWYVASSTR